MPIHGCAERLRRLEHATRLLHIVDRAITLIDQHLRNRLLKYWFRYGNSTETGAPDPLPAFEKSLRARFTRSGIPTSGRREGISAACLSRIEQQPNCIAASTGSLCWLLMSHHSCSAPPQRLRSAFPCSRNDWSHDISHRTGLTGPPQQPCRVARRSRIRMDCAPSSGAVRRRSPSGSKQRRGRMAQDGAGRTQRRLRCGARRASRAFHVACLSASAGS